MSLPDEEVKAKFETGNVVGDLASEKEVPFPMIAFWL